MIRLILLLSAVLFLTLQVAGRDFGQKRPGLMAAQETGIAAPATPPQQAAAQPEVYVPTNLPVVQPLPKTALLQSAPTVIAVQDEEFEVRYVTAKSVNVREGPSTDFAVVDRLSKGDAARVIAEEENGWVLILIEGDGIEGYVSGRLLATTAP
jgi:uncharacterized protein YgiM (DUF1202 family)